MNLSKCCSAETIPSREDGRIQYHCTNCGKEPCDLEPSEPLQTSEIEQDIKGTLRYFGLACYAGVDSEKERLEAKILAHIRSLESKLEIAAEALESIGKFKGNLHICRECHGDSAEELSKEASEALSKILPPTL